MPGYEVLEEDEGSGLLPWEWAVERLRHARNYWLSTVREDGPPHSMALWGVWLDDCFYFSTGRNSRKVRNLATNPACVVTTESADEAVIVEGVAELLENADALRRLETVYEMKYGMAYPADSNVYRVTPKVAFAFVEDEGAFLASATRWRFSKDS